MALRTNWGFKLVKRDQYWIAIGRDGFTHPLRVQILKLAETRLVFNEQWTEQVSIELELHYALPETSNWSKRDQRWIGIRCRCTTHFLRLQIGPNEISVELALDVVALHTFWDFKLIQTRSALNEKLMEWHYALPGVSNRSKRSQYKHYWDVITHVLTVQIGRNEISIQLASHGMALHTSWEFKLTSASN